jgi:hypothetical protein
MPMSRMEFRFAGLVSSSTVQEPAFISKHNTKVTEKEHTEIKTVMERKTTKQNPGNR